MQHRLTHLALGALLATPALAYPYLFRDFLEGFPLDGLPVAVAVLLPSLAALEAARIAPTLARSPGGFTALTQQGIASGVRVALEGATLIAFATLCRALTFGQSNAAVEFAFQMILGWISALVLGVISLIIPIGGPLWVAALRRAVLQLGAHEPAPDEDQGASVSEMRPRSRSIEPTATSIT